MSSIPSSLPDRISEDFHRNLSDPLCKRIFLGICHDGGYVRDLNLHQLASQATDPSRITLLTSWKTNPAYLKLLFEIVRFPGLFLERRIDGVSIPHPATVQRFDQRRQPKLKHYQPKPIPKPSCQRTRVCSTNIIEYAKTCTVELLKIARELARARYVNQGVSWFTPVTI